VGKVADMINGIGYTADILQSAQSLADHAGRNGAPKIERDDIELAIQMRKRTEFFEPPPRDVSGVHTTSFLGLYTTSSQHTYLYDRACLTFPVFLCDVPRIKLIVTPTTVPSYIS
jgi:hypothetical protein